MSTPTEGRDMPGGSAPAPTVSTAPAAAAGPRWWSSIPSHIGPARTSTVVLALLFVAIFALWLQVKPAETATVPTGAGTVQQQQPAAPTTEAPAPATTAPPTTDEPEPTTEDETTTEDESTTPSTPTTSSSAPPTTESPEVTDEPAPTTPTGPTGGAGATAPTTP